MLPQQLLDHQTTALVLLDAGLKIKYLNPAAEALLETSGRRSIGASLDQIFVEENQSIKALLNAVNKGYGFSKRDAKLVLFNGHSVTVDYAVSPILAEGQQHFSSRQASLLIELQPRDRLKRISREEEIISTQAATQSLVRGVAHEIKNPLGGIRGAAQLLERELPSPELKEYTGIIIDEADRLRNLVDKLLGPRKLPKHKLTNIHEITERVGQIVQVSGIDDIKIVKDYDPSIPELMMDDEQLIQVLLNIVQNAIQALQSHDQQESPQITLVTRTIRQFTIGTKRHRLVCLVKVIDNGPGIPEEIRETLFYPMVSGRAEGSGLGLSIAQSIINQHKGIIECSSSPGHTEFQIFLPLGISHE